MRRIRWFFLLLAMGLILHNAVATTIVVGNCTKGDYEFNDISEAFNEVEDHSDVNIVICGDLELKWSEVVRANDIRITGGHIVSSNEYIKIYGDDVAIEDINLENVRIKVIATGDVTVRNVTCSAEDYCLDINAEGAVLLEDIRVRNAETGIRIRRADEVNVFSVRAEEVGTAMEIDTENVNKLFLNPVVHEVLRVEERIVEKNVPVKEIEYVIPPELYKQIQDCEDTVETIQRKKRELENEINELYSEIAELRRQKVYPNVWGIAASLLIGIVAGYLLGRI